MCLATFIRASPKRLALFECLQDELESHNSGLKPLCPTRWTVCTGALSATLENYPVICAELHEISRGYGDPSLKACGLLAQLDKFSVYFGLKLSHMVFAVSEQVSTTLQTKK